MHQTIIVLSLALWAFASTSARAAVNASPGTQTVAISAAREDLQAAQAALAVLAQGSLDTVYEMSTGRRLAVSGWGEVLQVKYGRRAVVHLRFDGKSAFVSRDGQMELRFELDSQGAPKLVRMTLPQSWL